MPIVFKNKWQAYCELAAAMVIVGSSVVAAKIITHSVPVFLAGGLRFAIASVLLIWLLVKLEGIPSVTGKDVAILFVQALTGVFGFSVFLLYGLKFTTAAASGIVTSTTPAVLGIISYLFLKERLEKRKITGIILAVCGILTLNLSGKSAGVSLNQAWIGNTLVFGAVICEALFTVLGKEMSQRLTPLAISTFVSLFGLLMFTPFAIRQAVHFDFRTLALKDWVSILYYGVVVTVGGFFLLYSGVSKVPISTSAVFTGILPLASLVLSSLILGEHIHPSQIIGFLLIMIGIVYSSREAAGTKVKISHSEVSMSFKFILIYSLTVFIASITPGPSMLLALNHGIKYGTRRTMASAFGNGAATLIQACLSIAGLGAILHHSAAVFNIIKYLGAAYLIYIGVTTFFSSDAGFHGPIDPRGRESVPDKKDPRPGALFIEGFCVTIGNPKAIIFFTALFPQVINTRTDTFFQSFIIVSLLLAIAFLCMMIYSYFGQKVQSLLNRSTMLRAFNRIVGGSFIGIGVGLATGKIN